MKFPPGSGEHRHPEGSAERKIEDVEKRKVEKEVDKDMKKVREELKKKQIEQREEDLEV